MKIKYHHWTCIVCGTQRKFTGEFLISQTPDWFTIKTAASSHETNMNRFSASVCSIDCLKGVHDPIHEYIYGEGRLPRKQHIEARICDFCAAIEKHDMLDIPVGGRLFEGWISHEEDGIRRDFCCTECRKKFLLNSEQSAFSLINTKSFWFTQKLLEIIDEDDFPEALKKLEDKRPEI